MSQIVLEHDVNKFAGLTERVEVRDATGRLLGYFHPTEGSLYADLDVPFSEQELRKREEATGGYTTAEVLEYLRKLGDS